MLLFFLLCFIWLSLQPVWGKVLCACIGKMPLIRLIRKLSTNHISSVAVTCQEWHTKLSAHTHTHTHTCLCSTTLLSLISLSLSICWLPDAATLTKKLCATNNANEEQTVSLSLHRWSKLAAEGCKNTPYDNYKSNITLFRLMWSWTSDGLATLMDKNHLSACVFLQDPHKQWTNYYEYIIALHRS